MNILKSVHDFLLMDYPIKNVNSDIFFFLHGKRICIMNHCQRLKNLKNLESIMAVIAIIPYLYGKPLFKLFKRILKQGELKVSASCSDVSKGMKTLIVIPIMYFIFFAKLLALNINLSN